MNLFASIYIGSGEVILKVFDIGKEKGLREIDCLRKPTNLLKDIYSTGSVSLETTEKLCEVLLDMKKTMAMYEVEHYKAYAGHTLMSATNERFVLEQIRLHVQIPVTSLSNSEHRFLGYQAVASNASFNSMVEKDAVLIDIGGVNLQITLFQEGKIVTTQHLKLGTYSTRASLQKLGQMKDYREQISSLIDKELDTFVKVYMKDIQPTYMILIGDRINKSMTDLEHNEDGVLTEVEKFDKFIKKALKEKSNMVSKDMRDMDERNLSLEPLLFLYREVLKMIPAQYVMVPGVSVNEGMAYDYAYQNKILKSNHSFEDDILSASWSIAKRYNSYEPHLKALEKMSLQIFDVMKNYHSMGKRERLLMRVVCILHDCGKYISLAGAADCSYTIIKSSEILGLTHKEREMVATIAEYNRKELASYEELAERLSEKDYWTMVQLLAILKVANAMDRSNKQKFKNTTMSVKDKDLIISIESNDSLTLEKGMFNSKADFFQQVFAIRPVIKEKRVLN